VYVGHEWYSRYRLDYDRFDYVWIPRYGKNDGTPEGSKKPSYPCDLWQYTSVGKAPGISGNVDLNALTGTKPMAYFTDTAESKITGGDNVAIDFDKYILSTGTHYISNSGKDENGTYHGGQAGDQSGHEWELKKWYSRPWTVVLRWPDIKVALKMAELGISAALNDRIGYDQYQRTTYWKQLEKAGYDPSKITVACEEDCTAGVTANCKAAGFLMDVPALEELAIDTYSANMKTRFVRAGFRALTESKYLTCPNYLLPGDVLLYEGHHAAMNITYGKNVRPENVSKPPENMSKPPEDDALLRKGDGGDDVRQMQRLLLKWDPDCLPKYGADGDFGSETLRALTRFQDFRGLAASGVYDEPTRQALVAYTNSLAAGTEQPALEYDEEPAYTVTITGESVNVRAGNSLSSAVLGVVHRGDLLPYQGVKSADGGRTWLLVEYEGQNGWVSDKYAEVTEG